MKPKIYIDCTHTYYSNYNTGIQRVVRNIVHNINVTSNNYDISILAVILGEKNYHIIEKIPEVNFSHKQNTIKLFFKKIYTFFRHIFSFLPIVNRYLYSAKTSLFLNDIYDKIFSKQKKITDNIVSFERGDILLLLDSTWAKNDFEYLATLKKKGIIIISVIYDMIPITHKEFCAVDTSNAYLYWFNEILKITDGFIAISDTVKKELINYIERTFGRSSQYKYESFLLGADIVKNIDITCQEEYKILFDKKNTYLTVSTIEPRKNHEYILNTFDSLWEKGLNVKYIMIGRIGWKNNDIINRIKNHKEFNRRLFLLTEVDDECLTYAYKHSKSLIFASHIEGFGLPIIESLYNNMQVLASDIPIHREIGRDFVTYFDILDKNSLEKIIINDNLNKNIQNFEWLTWEESTDELIYKTLSFKVEN